MRRGEILGLRWKDIDFEKKELKVIQTANWTRDGLVIQRPKTNHSIRRVKLFQNIIDDLQERYLQIEAYKIDYGEATRTMTWYAVIPEEVILSRSVSQR